MGSDARCTDSTAKGWGNHTRTVAALAGQLARCISCCITRTESRGHVSQHLRFADEQPWRLASAPASGASSVRELQCGDERHSLSDPCDSPLGGRYSPVRFACAPAPGPTAGRGAVHALLARWAWTLRAPGVVVRDPRGEQPQLALACVAGAWLSHIQSAGLTACCRHRRVRGGCGALQCGVGRPLPLWQREHAHAGSQLQPHEPAAHHLPRPHVDDAAGGFPGGQPHVPGAQAFEEQHNLHCKRN